MPRSTREYLLRSADHALNDLDRCLENMQSLHANYEPTHPKYAKYIELVTAQVLSAQEDLKKFRERFM